MIERSVDDKSPIKFLIAIETGFIKADNGRFHDTFFYSLYGRCAILLSLIDPIYKQTLTDAQSEHLLEEFFDTTFLQNEHTYYNMYPEFFWQFKIRHCKQLSNTTVVNTMNYLRTFLRWCIKQGITDNDCYKTLSFPNAVYGDAFFLNIEERNNVYSADLSGRRK